MQGYVRVARHRLSEADLCQELQPAACRRGAGPVLLGHAVSCREELAGPDDAFCDLPEVELADLGMSEG